MNKTCYFPFNPLFPVNLSLSFCHASVTIDEKLCEAYCNEIGAN